jgi:thiamine-monophosphate kinase
LASKISPIKGEFELIQKIRAMIKPDKAVVLGIGDDAAVIRNTAKQELLFTTDMLIENRHFKLSEATPYEIGWKALGVNISDIAAMGGVPTYAVVALGLPKNTTVRFVQDLYRGMNALAKIFKIRVVGGDTNRSENLVVSVALLGVIEKGHAIRRSGCSVGDVIAVSGPLGASYKSKKHLHFMPRVHEARFLTKNYRISAMMDISDGLSSDLHRLAEAGGIGVLIDEKSIPLNRQAKQVREAFSDGEDFELLYTLPASEAKRLSKSAANKKNQIFYPIGWVTDSKKGLRVKNQGQIRPLRCRGFDHFK